MKVKFAYLKHNPFDDSQTDLDVVSAIREAIHCKGTDGIKLEVRTCPYNQDYFEMVDGKHRLSALQAELGEDGEVEVFVREQSDQEMMTGWLHYNYARRTVTREELTRLLKQAVNYIRLHPEKCERMSKADIGHSGGRKGCQAGFHGSAGCVRAFLKIEKMSRSTIARLLEDQEEKEGTDKFLEQVVEPYESTKKGQGNETSLSGRIAEGPAPLVLEEGELLAAVKEPTRGLQLLLEDGVKNVEKWSAEDRQIIITLLRQLLMKLEGGA